MFENFTIIFWIIFISFFSLTIMGYTTKFRYKKSTTITLFVIFMTILIGANIFIYYDKELQMFELYNFVTILLPEIVFIYIVGQRGFSSTITSFLNTYLAIYTVQILKSSINRYLPSVTIYNEAIHILLYIFIWIYIRKFYIPFNNELQKYNKKLSRILLAFVSVIYLELTVYAFLLTLTTRDLIIELEIFAAAILSIYYFSFLIFYMIFKDYKNKLFELNDKELQKKDLLYLNDRLKIREVKDKELKILRHDLRHVALTVNQLLNNNNIDEAKNILNQYTENIDENYSRSYCNDHVIDSVIDYYETICNKNKIMLKVQMNNFEDILKISNYDFAIFISNCLENAVTATMKLEKNRKISVILLNNHGRLILQIKNTYKEKIKLDRNNNPTSYRKNHGIGTSSIQSFIKKYNLLSDYEITEDTFTINVLFN